MAVTWQTLSLTSISILASLQWTIEVSYRDFAAFACQSDAQGATNAGSCSGDKHRFTRPVHFQRGATLLLHHFICTVKMAVATSNQCTSECLSACTRSTKCLHILENIS